jgi:hypothetical protein
MVKNGKQEGRKSPDTSITHERLYKKAIHNTKTNKEPEAT